MGKARDAIEFIQVCAGTFDTEELAWKCETFLLDAGLVEEALEHAFDAKKCPSLPVERMLSAAIKSTPGEKSKWFATAKELKRFDLAGAAG